jgi:hypothetical protein
MNLLNSKTNNMKNITSGRLASVWRLDHGANQPAIASFILAPAGPANIPPQVATLDHVPAKKVLSRLRLHKGRSMAE